MFESQTRQRPYSVPPCKSASIACRVAGTDLGLMVNLNEHRNKLSAIALQCEPISLSHPQVGARWLALMPGLPAHPAVVRNGSANSPVPQFIRHAATPVMIRLAPDQLVPFDHVSSNCPLLCEQVLCCRDRPDSHENGLASLST